MLTDKQRFALASDAIRAAAWGKELVEAVALADWEHAAYLARAIITVTTRVADMTDPGWETQR